MSTSNYKIGDFKAPNAIRITDNNATSVVTQVINPFQFIANLMTQGVLTLFIDFETQRFPSSAENTMRESAITFPGIGPSFPRSRVEVQTIYNRNNPSSPTADTVRVRGSKQVCFVLIIWLTSFIVAYDPIIRSQLTPKLITLGYLPTILSELLKRTRTGICGNIRVQIGLIYQIPFGVLCSFNPEFKNSVFDPQFLATTIGQNTLLSLYAMLKNNEHNYIKFTDATKATVPPIEAGNTITATAITMTDRDDDFSQGTIAILPSTAYQNATVPATHLTDAFLTQATFSSGPIIQSLALIGNTYNISSNITSSIDYIFNRVTGLEPNPNSYKTEKPTTNTDKTHSLEVNSTSIDTTKTLPTKRFTYANGNKRSNFDSVAKVLTKPKYKKVLKNFFNILKMLQNPDLNLQALIV